MSWFGGRWSRLSGLCGLGRLCELAGLGGLCGLGGLGRLCGLCGLGGRGRLGRLGRGLDSFFCSIHWSFDLLCHWARTGWFLMDLVLLGGRFLFFLLLCLGMLLFPLRFLLQLQFFWTVISVYSLAGFSGPSSDHEVRQSSRKLIFLFCFDDVMFEGEP